jgi:hypothetical protein
MYLLRHHLSIFQDAIFATQRAQTRYARINSIYRVGINSSYLLRDNHSRDSIKEIMANDNGKVEWRLSCEEKSIRGGKRGQDKAPTDSSRSNGVTMLELASNNAGKETMA